MTAFLSINAVISIVQHLKSAAVLWGHIVVSVCFKTNDEAIFLSAPFSTASYVRYTTNFYKLHGLAKVVLGRSTFPFDKGDVFTVCLLCKTCPSRSRSILF